jgi:hypothetical protein
VRSLFRQQGILKLIHEARQAPGASLEAVPEA